MLPIIELICEFVKLGYTFNCAPVALSRSNFSLLPRLSTISLLCSPCGTITICPTNWWLPLPTESLLSLRILGIIYWTSIGKLIYFWSLPALSLKVFLLGDCFSLMTLGDWLIPWCLGWVLKSDLLRRMSLLFMSKGTWLLIEDDSWDWIRAVTC